ncbi:hypothetical protein Kfla_2865 [Kribbella flavida DSM 17836]|uniref:DUF4037 domain-containing protein n=1 Tax=Kribbella flavida (strain DSM 17836 / JCM 10339 / NBRC 14399) TaxID=479435 RepID=D2Q0D8_KRIFD|nr:DUF4037 domain-containing protein [Kribbella flavida]ADB31930.1 hypothetical protein Kfla_2865 [Kribbella flavida DSM 17836]
MTTFISARELGDNFHAEVIRPLLGDRPYAAGLLGWGSDVLGYDTARSTDHGWGPRLHVFVDAGEVERVTALIDENLPDEYRGYPVRFGWDTQHPVHHVTVSTVAGWLVDHLGFDASAGISTPDWLITPQQKLLGVVAGRVYADDGRLQPIRDALQWYPDDVWLWMLACQWSRIAQEEPFVQRTHEVGDDLGSRVLAARLVRDAMRLALLLRRTYAPYSKWLGTAFARLGHEDGLDEVLADALAADDLPDRERALVTAYGLLARRHNALGITDEVDPAPRQFHDRPATVLGAERFAEACVGRVRDPRLRGLELVGSIDQCADSTDLLSNPVAYRRLVTLYDGRP